jgi:hypothetical protein
VPNSSPERMLAQRPDGGPQIGQRHRGDKRHLASAVDLEAVLPICTTSAFALRVAAT